LTSDVAPRHGRAQKEPQQRCEGSRIIVIGHRAMRRRPSPEELKLFHGLGLDGAFSAFYPQLSAWARPSWTMAPACTTSCACSTPAW
jgi:hypothetical protein